MFFKIEDGNIASAIKTASAVGVLIVIYWIFNALIDTYLLGVGELNSQLLDVDIAEFFFFLITVYLFVKLIDYARASHLERKHLYGLLKGTTEDVEKIKKHAPPASRVVMVGGILLAEIFWFFDVLVDVYVFGEGNIMWQVFEPTTEDAYVRFAVASIIIISSLYAKKLISGQEILDSSLENAYSELKDVDRLKTDILSNVSHELRTPITIVKGALEMLSEDIDPETEAELTKKALEAVMRQNEIVEDLVMASKLNETMPETDLILEELDIVGLLKFTTSEFGWMATEKGIGLSIEASGGRVMIKADYRGMRRLVKNLLSNAIKYTIEGDVIVSIKEKRDTVEICVKDTGLGIAKENLEAIFENLYQIDPSSTRRYGGIGMGLAVVKNIVEAHSGKIWVESELGKGSKFFVSLPTE